MYRLQASKTRWVSPGEEDVSSSVTTAIASRVNLPHFTAALCSAVLSAVLTLNEYRTRPHVPYPKAMSQVYRTTEKVQVNH